MLVFFFGSTFKSAILSYFNNRGCKTIPRSATVRILRVSSAVIKGQVGKGQGRGREGQRQNAEGRRQNAEGRRQNAEGRNRLITFDFQLCKGRTQKDKRVRDWDYWVDRIYT